MFPHPVSQFYSFRTFFWSQGFLVEFNVHFLPWILERVDRDTGMSNNHYLWVILPSFVTFVGTGFSTIIRMDSEVPNGFQVDLYTDQQVFLNVTFKCLGQ